MFPLAVNPGNLLRRQRLRQVEADVRPGKGDRYGLLTHAGNCVLRARIFLYIILYLMTSFIMFLNSIATRLINLYQLPIASSRFRFS